MQSSNLIGKSDKIQKIDFSPKLALMSGLQFQYDGAESLLILDGQKLLNIGKREFLALSVNQNGFQFDTR